jgi:hypothetical protein
MMRVASSVGELSNARATFTLQKNRPMNWEIRVVPKATPALDWVADIFRRRFSSMVGVLPMHGHRLERADRHSVQRRPCRILPNGQSA